DGSGDLVPVPRVVPVVLVVSAQLSGVGVEGKHRGRVEVVAGPLVAHPLGAVAGPPVREVELGVVGAGDPDGHPARAPRVALPGLRPGLTGSGNGERLPRRAAGAGVEGLDEAADSE